LTGWLGIMAVNELSPRVQPKDEVCLHNHNSLATSQSLIYLLKEARATQLGHVKLHPSNECLHLGYASFLFATVENGYCVSACLFTTRTVFVVPNRKKRCENWMKVWRKWWNNVMETIALVVVLYWHCSQLLCAHTTGAPVLLFWTLECQFQHRASIPKLSASSQNNRSLVRSQTEYSSSLALGAWPWLNHIYNVCALLHCKEFVHDILIGQNDNLREVKYEPYPTFALWDVKYGSYSLLVS